MAETLAPQPALDRAMKTPTSAGLNGPSRYTARTANATERTASAHRCTFSRQGGPRRITYGSRHRRALLLRGGAGT